MQAYDSNLRMSIRQTTRSKGWLLGSRILAPFCCLLLLLPVLNVRMIVSSSTMQESEESRQPTEEERSSEDSIDARNGHRRCVEQVTAVALLVGRGGGSCRISATSSPSSASERAEHRLRNGVGAPLRC